MIELGTFLVCSCNKDLLDLGLGGGTWQCEKIILNEVAL